MHQPTPNSSPAQLRQLTRTIERVWRELTSYGHDLSRVDIGIWDRPRTYQIRFLANNAVVEIMEAHLASPADFDTLRSFTKRLTARE